MFLEVYLANYLSYIEVYSIVSGYTASKPLHPKKSVSDVAPHIEA